MEQTDLDIAIVGAGAAGLMAAIFAGRTVRRDDASARIAALDGAARVGAKILVAGGGRCNVTHDVVRPEDFFGGNRNQIAKVLRTFDVPATIRFFASLGVRLKTEETGKLFPVTDEAHTVLDALLRAVHDAGGEIWTSCRIHQIHSEVGRFTLHTARGPVTARRVILATGGMSLPKTGSDGGGYALARTLRHSISTIPGVATGLFPGLVPLVLPHGHWLTELSGISVEAELSLAAATRKVLHRQRGAMLFTHFGLSGPAVLDLSRHWIAAHAADPGVALIANLLPGRTFAAVDEDLMKLATRQPRQTVREPLGAWLPQRLATALCRQIRVDPAGAMTHLSKENRRALARTLTGLPLPVVRDRGWNFAEVTAGGVPLSELDLATLASRRCPGLYLCGEVLDVDGRIGGYNFQWAWTTGRLAGLSAAVGL